MIPCILHVYSVGTSPVPHRYINMHSISNRRQEKRAIPPNDWQHRHSWSFPSIWQSHAFWGPLSELEITTSSLGRKIIKNINIPRITAVNPSPCLCSLRSLLLCRIESNTEQTSMQDGSAIVPILDVHQREMLDALPLEMTSLYYTENNISRNLSISHRRNSLGWIHLYM